MIHTDRGSALLRDSKDYKVPKDKFLEVAGPAAVRILKGSGVLMGKRVGREDFIIVPRWRTYVIRASEEMTVNISQSKETEVKVVDYNVALMWERKLKNIKANKIVVAGPVDSGKSSVTTTLVNMMIEEGREVEVINSDVGQSNFCLPTTVCKSKVKDFIFTLHDLTPAVSKFTGTITPSVEGERVIASTAFLIGESYILDTDGWVEGYEAGRFKRSLLEAVKPEVVIYLGEPPWWTTGPWKIVGLPPTGGRSRSRGDRRTIRKEKYKRALEKCEVREIDLKRTPVLYSRLFTSRADEAVMEATAKVLGTRPLLVAVSNGKVIAVVKKRSKYRRTNDVEVVEEGEERGLLVGLGDEEGNERLGMIVRIDYRALIAKVRTCFDEKPSYVSFGRVKLGEDWSDSICRKPF